MDQKDVTRGLLQEAQEAQEGVEKAQEAYQKAREEVARAKEALGVAKEHRRGVFQRVLFSPVTVKEVAEATGLQPHKVTDIKRARGK